MATRSRSASSGSSTSPARRAWSESARTFPMTTANPLPGRPGLRSIGQVLASLRSEFPDISISKIRFLEAEGLLSPQRAPSGYRRYDNADVERLRYVLSV